MIDLRGTIVQFRRRKLPSGNNREVIADLLRVEDAFDGCDPIIFDQPFRTRFQVVT